MRLAFYAPLKPPDHPVPSGDRRMAQLLIQAWEQAGHQVEVASRLASREARGRRGQPGGRRGRRRRARAPAGPSTPPARRPTARPPGSPITSITRRRTGWGPIVARALAIPYLVAEASRRRQARRRPPCLGPRRHRRGAAGGGAGLRHQPGGPGRAGAPGRPCPIAWSSCRPSSIWRPSAAWPDSRAAARRTIAERHGLDAGQALAADRRHDAPRRQARLLSDPGPGPGGAPRSRLAASPRRRWSGAAEVEAALAPLGADRVRYLGRLEEGAVAACHAAADLCLWPAVNEAYGMALLEAQAAGLPVVAGAVGGVPSIVADGITGLLTPPGEASAFAAAARALIDAPARRAAMAARRPRECAPAPRHRRRSPDSRPGSCRGLRRSLGRSPRRGGLTMALLALLRHGPTSWTAARRLQGRTDLPLSPEGRQAVARWRLAPEVAGFAWLTSPLQRARETAALLGHGEAPVEARLIEMSFGEWEGPPLARSPGRAGAGDGRDRGPRPRFPRPRRREPARGPGPASGRCWPSSAATAATGWR